MAELTPDDVDAIRDELRAEKCSLVRVPQLCDALEAAWAERDGTLKIAQANLADYREMRERAERAEAALVDLQAWADHESDRADRAEESSANERQKVVNLTGELAVVNDHLADVIERAERAEAERDAALDAWHGMGDAWAVERERAERAEKRCDELRPWAASWAREGQVAVAALARARALCEDPNTLSPTSLYWDHIHPDDLRAAVEGDNQ